MNMTKRGDFISPKSNIGDTSRSFKHMEKKDDISNTLKDFSKPSKGKNISQDLLFAYSERNETNSKISLIEFQSIIFDHTIPFLMVDLIKYLTDYEMFKEAEYVTTIPALDIYDEETTIIRK